MWLHFLLVTTGVFASLYWTSYGNSTESSDIVTNSSTLQVTSTAGNPPPAIGTEQKKAPDYFKMSLTKECCTRPAIHSDYEAIGKHIKIGDLDAYQTGDANSTRVLISVYDIFGYHPNTEQFCDQLAKAGFLVVMPDFFRGSPWDSTNFPPKDRQILLDWVTKAGSWPKVVDPDLRNVIAHYKAQGATSFGIFGFCWGGKMSIVAGAHLADDLKGAALIHGSFIDAKDADEVKVPVLFIPSKTDADQVPFYKKVQERLGQDASEHYRIEDQEHGFAAARGDFKDPLTRTRVEEVIGHVSKFFNKHLSN